jgi:SAM-dependent methyltransferase
MHRDPPMPGPIDDDARIAALGAEPDRVRERYARRRDDGRYGLLNPDVWQGVQERQRAMLRLFREHLGLRTLSGTRVLEVGCGTGANLLELLRLGCEPEDLTGVELLPERLRAARHRLPAAVGLHLGDALALDVADGSQDVVLQSTVFSSLLDVAFQQALAARMWRWTRPGGGVLWYDFAYDNPRNPDVRGQPLSHVRRLFPQGRVRARRVTLAPPIGRAACRLHPRLYVPLNQVPWLRTHLLCWIAKAR